MITVIEMLIIKTHTRKNIQIEQHYNRKKMELKTLSLTAKIKVGKTELLSTFPLTLEYTIMRQ